MYAGRDPCPIEDALGALARAVDDELLGGEGVRMGETKVVGCC